MGTPPCTFRQPWVNVIVYNVNCVVCMDMYTLQCELQEMCDCYTASTVWTVCIVCKLFTVRTVCNLYTVWLLYSVYRVKCVNSVQLVQFFPVCTVWPQEESVPVFWGDVARSAVHEKLHWWLAQSKWETLSLGLSQTHLIMTSTLSIPKHRREDWKWKTVWKWNFLTDWCNIKVNFTALNCIKLHCTALYTVLHCTVLYFTLLHCNVQHCIALYSTVQYCTVLYSAALHCSKVHSILYHTTQVETNIFAILPETAITPQRVNTSALCSAVK